MDGAASSKYAFPIRQPQPQPPHNLSSSTRPSRPEAFISLNSSPPHLNSYDLRKSLDSLLPRKSLKKIGRAFDFRQPQPPNPLLPSTPPPPHSPPLHLTSLSLLSSLDHLSLSHHCQIRTGKGESSREFPTGVFEKHDHCPFLRPTITFGPPTKASRVNCTRPAGLLLDSTGMSIFAFSFSLQHRQSRS